MRFVVVLVVSCLLARSGHAEPPTISESIAQIAQLETALEYEQALMLATRTIARGEATHDQLASLHLIAGRLAAGLDHPEEAQAHFAKVLALRPETVLVAGTSPKLQAPFDAAKASAVPLTAKLVREEAKARVLVVHDPLGLIVGVRARAGANVVTERHSLEVAIASADPIVISALDESGNELVRETASAPIVALPAVPLYKHWGSYAVITGVALVAAGVCAWRYSDAQDEFDRGVAAHEDYTSLHAIEQRGQRWAIGADLGFGVAAITGVTSIILFATRPRYAEHLAVTANGVAYTATF